MIKTIFKSTMAKRLGCVHTDVAEGVNGFPWRGVHLPRPHLLRIVFTRLGKLTYLHSNHNSITFIMNVLKIKFLLVVPDVLLLHIVRICLLTIHSRTMTIICSGYIGR